MLLGFLGFLGFFGLLGLKISQNDIVYHSLSIYYFISNSELLSSEFSTVLLESPVICVP